MNITLKCSADNARTLKWLLGLKYGKRKSLETLLKMAAWEVAQGQAEKVDPVVASVKAAYRLSQGTGA